MCNACLPIPSHERSIDAFDESLIGMLNHGALSLMVSIGHRTGLFDAVADLPPPTQVEIAAHSGLDSRYVQEWLGAMRGEELALEMLRRAGFEQVAVHRLEHDFQNSFYVTEKA
jgi:hypothetical protein